MTSSSTVDDLDHTFNIAGERDVPAKLKQDFWTSVEGWASDKKRPFGTVNRRIIADGYGGVLGEFIASSVLEGCNFFRIFELPPDLGIV